MARFIQAQYPATHSGVERVERAADHLKQAARRFDGARGAATMLLAAAVSALLVVANELVETWTEGHLLAAWVVLWTIGFAAMALLAEPAREIGAALRARARAWSAARRQAAEDEKLWQTALTDARVMADLSRAMSADAARDIRKYY